MHAFVIVFVVAFAELHIFAAATGMIAKDVHVAVILAQFFIFAVDYIGRTVGHSFIGRIVAAECRLEIRLACGPQSTGIGADHSIRRALDSR
jgi:hypothetical protein